jgi:uncharacterized circularly permuted ATP-grasp superfamily protein/uncharacterized alpha-E superfamily protein
MAHASTIPNDRPPTMAGLLDGYVPQAGVFDEMVAADGTIRPLWQPLVERLRSLSGDEARARFDRADRYLRDAGVYYRVYGTDETSERDWPLSPVPLLIDGEEWNRLAAGLVQRAELLEAIAADIYGDNTLVRDGALPPQLIASNPEYLRPMAGVRPAGGHYLHFLAFELGRGPDGGWWVLGDRTQAPSGAGFALENRVATRRALSDVHADMNVHRLAGFFKDFRDALRAMAGGPGELVGIVTPGPHNETYFEHAYIARYLGFLLLEGEDLVVVDGQAMVRTVAGMKPIHVLWRRMDAAFMDPLAFNHASRIGTPGLADAARAGSVSLVNALGTGILETRALLAFYPRLARRLLRTDLLLPNVATWWCGQPEERRHVIDMLERMVVGPAMSTALPFEDNRATVHAGGLTESGRIALGEWLARDGPLLVGQEAVTLSTTPVRIGSRIEPRPVSLRVYAARTPAGWTLMPGGLARIGSSMDTSAIAMQRGGFAADVWVVSREMVEPVSLLPDAAAPFIRVEPGNLPSRAADNLFWLGRYTERAEDVVRALRAYHGRLDEAGTASTPLLAHMRSGLALIDIEMKAPVPQGLVTTIDSALRSAGNVRERFSPDGWLALNDLAKTSRQFAARVTEGDDTATAMTVLLRKLAGLAGLIHENMYRFTGWRFLRIGRALERAQHMSRVMGYMIHPPRQAPMPDGTLDMLLEIGDSILTHRRRYAVDTRRDTVVDLLALDPLNPRSIRFQLDEIAAELAQLPAAGPASETVHGIIATLAAYEPVQVDGMVFRQLTSDLATLSDAVAQTYLA